MLQAFLFPAWLLATALVALASYASINGFCGIHIWDLPPVQFSQTTLVRLAG